MDPVATGVSHNHLSILWGPSVHLQGTGHSIPKGSTSKSRGRPRCHGNPRWVGGPDLDHVGRAPRWSVQEHPPPNTRTGQGSEPKTHEERGWASGQAVETPEPS